MGNRVVKHTLIEKAEPWNKKEIHIFTLQERWFMRDIQYSRNIHKKEAITYYMNYLHKSKVKRKQIRKEIIEDIQQLYPEKERTKFKLKRGEHVLPSGKKIKRPKEYSLKYESFEEWERKQRQNNKEQTKYYNRVVKAHKKYPEKSLKELRGH